MAFAETQQSGFSLQQVDGATGAYTGDAGTRYWAIEAMAPGSADPTERLRLLADLR
ncbi:MAG: hypothetical protein FWD74_09560 [Actinomycetia bacterium]|nr:hypothetical protein [Actinomycetes bacterium]